MQKNVASQTAYYFAFDSTTNAPKSGDAANIVCYVSKDAGAVAAIAASSGVPTEVDSTNAKGYYKISLAQGETNGDMLLFSAKSSTSNVVVIAVPALVYTIPTTGLLAPATAGRTLVVDASGLADANTVKVGPSGSGTTQTSRDLGLALPAAAPNANGGLPILSSSGTTLAYTVSTVTTLTNLPAITAGWLTATGIAADAITAAKIADGAIDAATFAAGAIDSSAIATDAITAAKIAADAIGASELATSAVAEIAAAILATPANLLATDSSGRVTVGSLAAGSITATAIAADAIGASELAADAVAEIAAAILTNPANLLATDASGRVTVGSLAAGSITAAVVATDAIDADALASDAVTEIQSGLATSANQTTILNRLGSFTGSGINTVLGFFKALLKSDATTPSDVGGTFDPSTDSTQAIRDRGDAAWVTATGFSTLDAAGVRTAVGLASANLDTQLATIAGYIDTEIATLITSVGAGLNTAVLAVKAKTDHLPSSDVVHTLGKLWVLDGSGNAVAPASDSSAIKARTDNLPASPAAVGSAMTLANGAITEATITAPAETAGRPTGILGMIRRVFEWTSNKRTRDRSDGTVLLRNAADSATLETQTQSTSGTVDTITRGG